ncbi:spermidine synthase [Rhizobium mongolense]|uniref:Spermidine synthase n=1 Tax=Rhizobium mongolense TaxID=57676 RepID=A0ABR6ISD3_9HYPH|nr:spermidine synthase [Rhizobium mongolense]
MAVPTVDRVFGRVAFGADPSNYHAARPRYPEETWELLRERSDLGPGVDILEIGAGTGLATAELLAHKPRRLAAVEPDMRLADFLRTSIAVDCLQVLALHLKTQIWSLPRSTWLQVRRLFTGWTLRLL